MNSPIPHVKLRRLCIIGVGLIGGSLARALRRAGVCEDIVGCGRSEENLRRAVELGVIDRFDTDVSSAVHDADMIVVAVPLGAVENIFRTLDGNLAEDALITDVGSAKRCIIDAARAAFGAMPPNVVPAHPIAGNEHSGVEASIVDLFENRRVILTPVTETDPRATARVRAMWEATGAAIWEMDAGHHDEVLAATSHLPHMLAYTLVDVLGRMNDRVEIFRYAAGGFRDFTRIASSDPRMWHDICIANREAIVGALELFETDLHAALEAIRGGDGEMILDLFQRAKNFRDQYTDGVEP